MPNLKLQPTEAADIAAYLLRDQQPQQAENAVPLSEPVDTDLVAQGKKFFVEFGCVNCHQLPGVEPKQIAKKLEELNFDVERSCLGSPVAKQPLYSLSLEQEDAIQNIAVPSNDGELTKNAHQLTMLQLNCFACHERNDLGGVGRNRQQYFETVGHVDIGDEGRLPPQLTYVGKKLTPGWFSKVLDGKGDIRPHMTIRMPVFPKTQVNELPKQLALVDKVNSASEADVFGELAKLANPGRKLLNTGCIQCHPLRGESLASVVGTDLDGVHERVRPAWFKEFLHNPIALKQRTRMPTFFPNGVSSNLDLLDGNVESQIAAIWTYLKENQKYPLPEKITEARSKNFELVPTDKPIVLRTFMKEAGLHAIAVGFPEKVNFAFDSENCRLVEAWKGRFLDAHGTWYNRFTPLEEPLGTDRVPMTIGVGVGMFVGGLDGEMDNFKLPSKRHFQGYKLDKSGTPTFRYHLAGYLVEERISPNENGELRRHFVIKSPVEGTRITTPNISLHFLLLTGKEITKIDKNTFVNEDGLSARIMGNIPLQPVVMKTPKVPPGKMCSARIPLQLDRIEFEVIYKW
ncbi:MAG: c-type cytochrome [Planctomicrobium sp.]|nr:c-type cytochrome [Planctomicrobium sp.]